MSPANAPSPSPGRPTRAEIDLAAFESNLALAMTLSGERREVMAVLKADGYGHGAVPLAQRAAAAGVSLIGVATVDEARRLRRSGIAIPIVLLGESHPDSAPEIVAVGATPVVYSAGACEALDAAARRAGKRIPVHLKIDTGMGRVGESPSAALLLADRIRRLPHLFLEGLLSHLSEADRLDTGFTFRQLKEFAAACRRIGRGAGSIRYFHIANSALVMRREAVGNLTRPGIMLYGSPPAPGFPDAARLTPVMRFVTEVAFLKPVAAGRRLSYGGTFRTTRKSVIATLPVGYADGYRRGLSNRADVIVRGRRAPQVGTVCMDLTLVDVTDVPGVAVGDEVVLIGRQGDEEVKADELAAHLGTISYEIFCGISGRVPRRYLDGESPPRRGPPAEGISGSGRAELMPSEGQSRRRREKTRYLCQDCGASSPKWLGRCPDCGAWNTFVEEAVRAALPAAAASAPPPLALDEISMQAEARIPSGSAELDRVLGGGLVPGSVILLGGDPGVGKTTLLLEALGRLSRERDVPVLYCTGEESPRQIKLRAQRIGLESSKLFIYSQNSVEGVIEEARKLSPAVVAIDSIQTVTSSLLESAAGSVGQVRQAAAEIVPFAKERELPVFLVGHVTKDGALAGPRILEHMVDTVLYFEGENTRDYRILRSVKNRFGSTNEIGIFEMSGEGLLEVPNPSRLFLREEGGDLAGSVVTASLEGTRPFLVEIQALCAPTGFPVPRRGSSGADPKRFAMLIAVLEKKVGLSLQDQDIYLNFTGGIRVTEPAADAAIITALTSSFRGVPVDHGTVVFGEVGLTGEIRPVVGADIRIREAAKLGFSRCIIPRSSLSSGEKKDLGVKVQGISHVSELFEEVLP